MATAVLDLGMVLLERHLNGGGRPSILDLEFSGTEARVTQIASEWAGHWLRLARLLLTVDFVFMACYGGFFALAALATRDLARAQGLRRLAAIGSVVPYFAIAAASFDAGENVIWLLALDGRGRFLAPLATGFATMKFSLLFVSIGYALCGLVVWLRSLRRAGSRSAGVSRSRLRLWR